MQRLCTLRASHRHPTNKYKYRTYISPYRSIWQEYSGASFAYHFTPCARLEIGLWSLDWSCKSSREGSSLVHWGCISPFHQFNGWSVDHTRLSKSHSVWSLNLIYVYTLFFPFCETDAQHNIAYLTGDQNKKDILNRPNLWDWKNILRKQNSCVVNPKSHNKGWGQSPHYPLWRSQTPTTVPRRGRWRWKPPWFAWDLEQQGLRSRTLKEDSGHLPWCFRETIVLAHKLWCKLTLRLSPLFGCLSPCNCVTSPSIASEWRKAIACHCTCQLRCEAATCRKLLAEHCLVAYAWNFGRKTGEKP